MFALFALALKFAVSTTLPALLLLVVVVVPSGTATAPPIIVVVSLPPARASSTIVVVAVSCLPRVAHPLSLDIVVFPPPPFTARSGFVPRLSSTSRTAAPPLSAPLLCSVPLIPLALILPLSIRPQQRRIVIPHPPHNTRQEPRIGLSQRRIPLLVRVVEGPRTPFGSEVGLGARVGEEERGDVCVEEGVGDGGEGGGVAVLGTDEGGDY